MTICVECKHRHDTVIGDEYHHNDCTFFGQRRNAITGEWVKLPLCETVRGSDDPLEDCPHYEARADDPAATTEPQWIVRGR